MPLFLIVREASRVYGAVGVEILPVAVLLVLKPVPNVEFALHVIVFALPVLHPLKEIPFVALGIGVFELATSLRLPLVDFSLIVRSIGETKVHKVGIFMRGMLFDIVCLHLKDHTLIEINMSHNQHLQNWSVQIV
jgi:hypothetical protein